jgi:hypothetical protein
VKRIRNVKGGFGDDMLIGNGQGNILLGGPGHNTIKPQP